MEEGTPWAHPRTPLKSLIVNISVIKKVRDFVITEVSFFFN